MSYAPQEQKQATYFVQSYAKINVTLDILGRRADGYHELATVMQTIDLYDTLCLTEAEEDVVRVVCSRPELSTSDNLVVRAAQAVRERLGLRRGVSIELQKRIPVAAGLAGGSSNATAVLRALQDWWNLPLTAGDLHEIAASLGSDVPFFLTGGLALCEGRGERITPLLAHWPAEKRWILLLKPAISVSTAAVFRALQATDYTDGNYSRSICRALEAKQPLEAEQLHNGLERGVVQKYPEVAEAREAMLRVGAREPRLSGSGPTLFATFAELGKASQVYQGLHSEGYEVYLTRAIFPNGENISYY